MAYFVITAECKRILIIGSRHVGNNLFCTPAIRFLKRNFPASQFDAVSTSRRGVDAFAGNPDLTNVRPAMGNWHIRGMARGYDLVIGMYREDATKCLRRSRVPRAIIEPNPQLHRVEQRLAFVRDLSGMAIVADDRRYMLAWTAADEAAIRAALPPATSDEMLIGIHLGCGRTASHGWKFWWGPRDQDPKLWPVEHYIALALDLKRSMPSVRLVITGSRNERFLARRFVAAVPGTIDLVGSTTLGSVAALMGRLRLFITHDTGILHVACATEVPILALFGPTNVAATGPYPLHAQHVVIQRETMAQITPRAVCDAALAMV